MVLLGTTVLAVVYGVVSKRYERALAIGAITPTGAALVAGPQAVPTFYAVALAGVVLLVWQWIASGGVPGAPRLARIPGVPLMIALVVWAAVVVALAPMLFPGLETVTQDGRLLTPGMLDSSNVAQVVYLALSVAVVVILVRSPTTSPAVLAIPLGAGVAIALWRYLSLHAGVPFPEGLFDNSPAFHYNESAPGGVERFRGIHSEPAGLAGTAIVAAAYGLASSARVRGWARAAALAMAVAAVFLGIVSTSTTFVIAGVVLLILAVASIAWRLLTLKLRVSLASVIVAGVVVVSTIVALPVLTAMLRAQVDEKVASSSFTERAGSDSEAFSVFLDTWGFGMGLGAVRASSLAFTVLGAVGTVGALLLVGAIAAIALPAMRLPQYEPVVWALAAALVVKVISSPELADTSGLMWLALGVLAHGVVTPRPTSDDALTRGGKRPHQSLPEADIVALGDEPVHR